MLARESGEWTAAKVICDGLRLDADIVSTSYWQAQQWACEVSSGA
jgi:hypothetical protein